ncbi:diacylglycerol kinase family protein [Jatrophihabitans endophyticus]|uniref:diacylglycerol/lipid kinase family protein n=1 Tax=Jatrophihabitans endophyticus TaxID=1206085 RepID=UPI0019E7FA1D|nr:diacylglycerol kinase family protein [Jatrophihabitans endophyticus]MBE7187901.1 diacylglycerol kinase family lipid kinase [Jatrophihabitans endophyticus]
MRILVVTNPHATATSARGRDVLVNSLASVAELEVAETANRGHAAALACRAMRNGTDTVVALGGDGTVNEVINGLLTDGVHDRVPSLGVVPTGSTNVFARALGLPNDPIEATGSLLEGLRAEHRRPVSLGLADDRWFCFAAGLGFDAAIVHGVERRRRQGKRSTHVLYTRVGAGELLRADRRHPQVHVELEDGSVLSDVFFTIVANADPWTYVGNRPLHPTPGVTFDSGLGLYARRRMSIPGLLFSMAGLSGSHPRIGRRGAFVRHDLRHITVVADEPLPLQVDGDALEPSQKVTFRSVPSAISIVSAPPQEHPEPPPTG